MTDQKPDPRPERRSLKRPRPLLAALLLVALAGLLVHLLAGNGARGESAARLAACAGRGAPQVTEVRPQDLGGLRASVARVLPERLGRLYEEGTIGGSSVWTDASPAGPTVSATALRPAGYEMRWWAPNGDDLVADVLLFKSPGAALRFLGRASGPRCGRASLTGASGRPPQARNLAWINPDNVAEGDVYLARGRRVYRVADAPAGQAQGSVAPARLQRALRTVDALACLLPGAHCSSAANNSVPA
jgi:hypothetical protein